MVLLCDFRELIVYIYIYIYICRLILLDLSIILNLIVLKYFVTVES